MTTVTERGEQPLTYPNITGLTAAEVEERIASGETNDFKLNVGRTYWEIIRDNILNIFNIVLFILLIIVLISQDYATVFFAGFSVVANSLIGTLQEINAKRKLDSLAELSAQQVNVLRDSQRATISKYEVVKDDIIIIEPGDRLVVDGLVVKSDSLEIDESQLTGESDPVPKLEGDKVTSGAFCLAGSGLMTATRVGSESAINRLSMIARIYKKVLTPTQQKVAAIAQVTLIVLLIFGPMIFISGYISDNTFLEIIRNTVVFVTSLVPQGLILVVTLSLTIGAIKISRHQTLIQRVNAVESLANVSVLCFDKTGTLTHNMLMVTRILPMSGESVEAVESTLRTYIGNLAHQNTTAAAVARYIYQENSNHPIPTKQREIPFTSARKWGAIILPDEVLIMGAPERVIGENHSQAELVDELSSQGYRVLAFARIDHIPEDLSSIHQVSQPIALIIIRDQVRRDIKETLNAFHEQEVKLKVISGDNLQTVCSVAKVAGMSTEKAFTGDELDAMTDLELLVAVEEADVFARIEPETKRRIVAALKQQGNHVAMVGDGVNDVPALKEADLAVVMNDGAQISKDIADIVLLNNAMSTLPMAFAEGREITQTIFGTTKMFLTKNFYNIFLFIFVLLMGLPFPVTPVQISWSAFGTVNIPAGLMALGILRPKLMRRFREDVLDYVITAGLVGAVGIATMYLLVFYYTRGNLEIARSSTTLFFGLYGWMIVLSTHGIDLLRPRTILEQPLPILISTVLTSGVFILATFQPGFFEFRWPPLQVIGLVMAIYILCVWLVNVGMKNRGLLHEFYKLLER